MIWGNLCLSPVNCLALTCELLSTLRGYGRNQHTAGGSLKPQGKVREIAGWTSGDTFMG